MDAPIPDTVIFATVNALFPPMKYPVARARINEYELFSIVIALITDVVLAVTGSQLALNETIVPAVGGVAEDAPETPEYPENPDVPSDPTLPLAPEYPENPEPPLIPEYPENPSPPDPEYPLNPETPLDPGCNLSYVLSGIIAQSFWSYRMPSTMKDVSTAVEDPTSSFQLTTTDLEAVCTS